VSEKGDLINQDQMPLAGREYQDFTMVQPPGPDDVDQVPNTYRPSAGE